MKKGDRIAKEIVSILQYSDAPLSTRDISLKLHRAWHSVMNHCLRLQIGGQIEGYRIGNVNVWSLRKDRIPSDLAVKMSPTPKMLKAAA